MNKVKDYVSDNIYWLWVPIFCIILAAIFTPIYIQSAQEKTKALSAYNDSKNDCGKLKQFLLDYYGYWIYAEAKERYGVMCKS